LHDRASYRYFLYVWDRARRGGQTLPEPARLACFDTRGG